jgi:serine/threonine protein kinase
VPLVRESDDIKGRVLRGKAHLYHLLDELGSGGMGSTYSAYEHKLGPLKKIAIKMLHPELAKNDPAARASFEQEPRAMAGLNHPNIVDVLWVDELLDGTPLYAMELLIGESAAHAIKRHGKIETYEAVNIAIDVLTGLHHAHKRGVVHQDVKPSNVMLHQLPGLGSVAKNIDFGIVRLVDDVQGGFAGTCPFAAPEQFRGEEVGPRADIFGVGGLLFNMLTGRRAFAAYGDGFDGAFARLDVHPPRISRFRRFPAELDALVAQALSPRQQDRPESARKMADALRKILREIDNPRPLKAYVSEVSAPITRAGLVEQAERTEPNGIDFSEILAQGAGGGEAQAAGHSTTAPAARTPKVAQADGGDRDEETFRSPPRVSTEPLAPALAPRSAAAALPRPRLAFVPISQLHTNPRPPISAPGDAAWRVQPSYVEVGCGSAQPHGPGAQSQPALTVGPSTTNAPTESVRRVAAAITAVKRLDPAPPHGRREGHVEGARAAVHANSSLRWVEREAPRPRSAPGVAVVPVRRPAEAPPAIPPVAPAPRRVPGRAVAARFADAPKRRRYSQFEVRARRYYEQSPYLRPAVRGSISMVIFLLLLVGLSRALLGDWPWSYVQARLAMNGRDGGR